MFRVIQCILKPVFTFHEHLNHHPNNSRHVSFANILPSHISQMTSHLPSANINVHIEKRAQRTANRRTIYIIIGILHSIYKLSYSWLPWVATTRFSIRFDLQSHVTFIVYDSEIWALCKMCGKACEHDGQLTTMSFKQL